MNIRYFDSFSDFNEHVKAIDLLGLVDNFTGNGDYLVLSRIKSNWYCNAKYFSDIKSAENEANKRIYYETKYIIKL